jgi:hypothetical protein
VANGTPSYGESDHAEIVGYRGADGEWHYVEDTDYTPPDYDDMEASQHYLIRIDTEAVDAPANMPDIVQWHGFIDEDVTLDDIYDYYGGVYEEIAG